MPDRNLVQKLVRASRSRLPSFALFFLFLWPLISMFGATATLRDQQIAHGATRWMLFGGFFSGYLYLIFEFVVIGLLLTTAGSFLFAIPEIAAGIEKKRKSAMWVEPVAFFAASWSGVAMEYPSVLRHLLLWPLWTLSATVVTAFLVLFSLTLALGVGHEVGGSRSALAAAMVVIATTATWWFLAQPRHSSHPSPASKSIFILGLDSLSQKHDLETLQRFAASRNGGVWYPKAISPSLITNSVWTSILEQRPASQTGVFFVYQRTDWGRVPYSMVRAAKQQGYHTVSFIRDQFTTAVGSDAGFDRDESGPRGWLQMATAELKNASIFLPPVLSGSGVINPFGVPLNQSGTFGYDLRADLHAFFDASSSASRLFVAGHLGYLHQPQFPGYSLLDDSERKAIRSTPVRYLFDTSFDWQYPEIGRDPLVLKRWKIRRLQKVVAEEIDESGVTRPERDNRIVIFSDHGDRSGIAADNFCTDDYFHVLLMTFGLRRAEAEQPVSLLSVASLVGLSSSGMTGAPAVEFTMSTADEWRALMKSAVLKFDGTIELDRTILSDIGKRILRCEPQF